MEKLGYVDTTNSLIQVSTCQNEQSQRITLLHELVHIIAIHAGMELSEKQVEGLSYGLYQMEQLNKWIFGGMNVKHGTTADKD